MSYARIQGAPWHVETLRMKNGDKRRDKRHCKFYSPIAKTCTKQKSCIGSAHCRRYIELSEKDYLDRKAEIEQIKRDMKSAQRANRLQEDRLEINQTDKETQESPQKRKYTSRLIVNLSPEQKKGTKKIKIGRCVYHDTYGKGIVLKRDNGIITVKYGEKIVKQNLKVLLEKNSIHF